MDAGSEYHRDLADEVAKLQRLFGGGELTSFPEFKFTGDQEPQIRSESVRQHRPNVSTAGGTPTQKKNPIKTLKYLFFFFSEPTFDNVSHK